MDERPSMSSKKLAVLIGNAYAGTLSQDENGLVSFAYDTQYDGAPLSLSMPLRNQPYAQNLVRPYLFGLLPDSERQRKAIALEFGVRPNNPVALLEHIGLDCPGGVQFCKPEDMPATLNRTGTYKPLNEHDIALKLKAIREDRDASWMGEDEHWSLGGNQGKFALYAYNGPWCECLGSAPTTHIFKNGVVGFKLEALNEFVCMTTAQWCDISTANVYYVMAEDEPALIVERYDRIVSTDGAVKRIHQEDLCQALGFMPSQKYTSDGGPTTADIQRLLARTSHATTNLQAFTEMLFYNCLIGAPDAHAKNYALLLGKNSEALLAPMYDVASGLAYDSLRRKGRLAMAIGGENRMGRVGGGAIERYAGANDPEVAQIMEANWLDAQACKNIMARLAQEVPKNMSDVFEANQGLDGMDELREHLLPHIEENCRRTLDLL